MALLSLAQVGCGGMGLRHVYGLVELNRQGFDTFDLVALCDLHESAASYVAAQAEKGLGKRPRIYTDYDTMLEHEQALDAINIVTDTRMHHAFAIKAFDAGKHVAVEKPMALTVRACQRMIEAALKKRKTLSVSENYRRDPMNRLVSALLRAGAIGEPRLMVNVSTGGGRTVQQIAAWRHLKLRGGLVIEFGVHTSDLILYFLGDVERVFAETHIWEKVRYLIPEPGRLTRFYGHRAKEDIEKGESFEATAEDTAFAVLRFASGATGQLTMSMAAPGERTNADIIYGSQGSLRLPGSRTGRPIQVTHANIQKPLGEDDVLALVPDFHLDDLTSRFFDGRRRLSSYDMSFEEIDRKLIGMELQDFAEAVAKNQDPEVTGKIGLKAVALSYAILESGYLRKPVDYSDVLEDRISAYQHEINESVGLATA